MPARKPPTATYPSGASPATSDAPGGVRRDTGADRGDQQQRRGAHGHRPGQHEEQLYAEDDEREGQSVPRTGGLRPEDQTDAEQRGEAGDGEGERSADLDRLDLLLHRLAVGVVVGPAGRLTAASGPAGPDALATVTAVVAGGTGTGSRRVADAGDAGRARVTSVGPRVATGLGGRGGKHDPIVPDRPGSAEVAVSETLKPVARSGAQQTNRKGHGGGARPIGYAQALTTRQRSRDPRQFCAHPPRVPLVAAAAGAGRR
jgi:hypothetical protein